MPTKAELQTALDLSEKENAELKRQLLRMERELSGKLLPEELPPPDMPITVKAWMLKHQMPWEVFWCCDHHQWVDELGSSFPWDIYAECPDCRRSGG